MTEQERLRAELERAYRAIRGLYGVIANGRQPPATMLAYHSLTIGAAIRFVEEGSLEGAEFFVGKQLEVLSDVLAKVRRQ